MWLTVGVFAGVTLMFTSVIVLTMTLYKTFTKEAPEQILTPVVSYYLCLFMLD